MASGTSYGYEKPYTYSLKVTVIRITLYCALVFPLELQLLNS